MTSWVEIAGWTLVHFIWEGAAIGMAAAIALFLLRDSRPQARYLASCAALAAMLVSPAVTAVVMTSGSRTPFAQSVHLLRSPQGAVLGFAITPPWSQPAGTHASALSAAPRVTLPASIDTDTVFSAVVTIWLAGVSILLLRLMAGCWRVRRLHAAARLEDISPSQSLAEQIAARLGLQRPFSVVDSTRVTTPTVIGWLRPIVLLPVAAMSGLSPRQVEAILAHELAHIRRHDFAINLLQTLAETILFYHPAVWWLSARIRTEREHCCDDVAVAVSGDAAEYAAALAELASWSLGRQGLAIAATGGPLVDRVRRLLRLPQSDRTPRRTTVAVAVVLTSVVAIGALSAIVRAQPVSEVAGITGPAGINRLLGFKLFPGPVQRPDQDPIGARGWRITVGGDGGELAMLGYTGRNLIRAAYDLDRTPIVNAPGWLDEEAYDLDVPIDLTVDNGVADPQQVQAALQELLEGRFGLVSHRETRTFPAYGLVLADANGRLGPSLKRSTVECVGDRRPSRDPAIVGPVLRETHVTLHFCGVEDNFFGLTGKRVTMRELAAEFHRYQYPLAPDRTVVDRTGLTGAYDFELRFGAIPLAAIGYANPLIGKVLEPMGIRSLFSALPEQLGLKLVTTTISREVLVIDQINRP
jgi:uncharacterized protein (TIGR03435 family)